MASGIHKEHASSNLESPASKDEEGIHLHCLTCFDRYCHVHPNCSIVYCDQKCGMPLHQCKQHDHTKICQAVVEPCINAKFGCPYILPRDQVAKHLVSCPASVTYCTMEWNRYPVYSTVREHWVPFSQRNPVKVQGDLDTELAFNDQDKLEKVQWAKMRRGKAKLRALNHQSTKVNPNRIRLLEKLLCQSSHKPRFGENLNQVEKGKDARYNNDISSKAKAKLVSQVNCPDGKTISNNEDVICIENHTNDESIQDTKHDRLSTNELAIVSSRVESTEVAKEAVIVQNSLQPDDKLPYKLTTQPITPYFMKTLGLNVIIETLPKFQKQISMYNFACAQNFRRDQYAAHFEHVHGDIHGGLNGWIMERCPLAQFGCTYVRHRLKPVSHTGKVVFSHDLGSFGIKPVATEMPSRENEEEDSNASTDLWSLPPELIETIAGYLDNFTLNNLALTCKALRDVCQTLLRRHGIVILEWEKRSYGCSSYSWQVKRKRWFYSTAFSAIHQWHFTDEPHMCNHLQNCVFFERHKREEKYEFPMIGMESISLKNDWI